MNRDEANDLVFEIGETIISDEAYSNLDWDAIVVVARIQPGVIDYSGYVFDSQGDMEAASPDNIELVDLFEKLQQATLVDGERPWVACKISVEASTMEVELEFEYEDTDRWEVTSGNPEIVAQKLRSS